MARWNGSNRIFTSSPLSGDTPAITHSTQSAGPRQWVNQILTHAQASGPLKDSLRSELLSLAEETDNEIFASDLYSLGQGQENSRNYALAGLFYQGVQNLTPQSPHARRAGQRMAVLTGGGPFSQRLEHLGREFIPTVFEPSLLIGMWAGARTFRGVSQGVLRLFAQPTRLSRGLAWGAGLSAEVPAFVFSARGVNTYLGRPVDWSTAAIGEDMRRVGLLLGALKTFGLAGQAGRIGAGEASALSPGLLRLHNRALPQLAMFGGILSAHSAETYLGWRDPQNLGIILLESLVTLIHFNAVGNLLSPWQSTLGLSQPTHRLRPQRALPNIRLGWQALTPEGITMGPPRFYSVGEAPSTIPPPPEGVRPARLARGSGIQAIAERGSYKVFRGRLGEIEGDLLVLFNSERFTEQWLIDLPKINGELLREIENVQIEVTVGTWDPKLLGELDTLAGELRQIDSLLERIQRSQSSSSQVFFQPEPGAIKSFFRDYYRFPNRMINFMDASANMESIVETLQTARGTLDSIANSVVFPKGPVFSAEVNKPFILESQRIGGEVLQIYSGRVNGHGPRLAFDTLSDFHTLLRQVHRRFLREGKPILFLEETETTFLETGQILNLMKGRGFPNAELLPPSVMPPSFLEQIYQAPSSFADFLMEGDITLLRSARSSSQQARQNLEANPD